MLSFKRLMVVTVAIAMAFAIFAGYAESTYVQTYPIVDEPITVVCALMGHDMTNPTRAVWEAVEKLTNIHVEFVNIERDQFYVYLAGNEWPDFFLNDFPGDSLYDYGVLGGRFVDYNDYKDIMPNLWKVFEEFPVALYNSTQINGEIYALPRIEKTLTITMSRMHVRTDILEAAGVGTTMPETPEEFYEMLVACRNYLNGQAPMSAFCDDIIFPAFGENWEIGRYDDGTGTVRDNRVEQQYRDYLSFMNKLYEEGLLHQEYLTFDGNTKNALFNEGKVAFTDAYATTIQKSDFADGEWHLDSMKPLVANKGDTPICVKPGYVQPSGFFVINAASPYVEEICKMIDIAFAAEEVQEGSGLCGIAFNYGPIGSYITIIDDSTYKIHYPDGSDINSADLGKVAIFGYTGYNNNERIVSGDTNLAARTKGWKDNVIPYATGERMPSVRYNEDEALVRDQYKTAFDSYASEMKNKFITGIEDIDDDAVWEKYCEGMKENGIEELLKIYQAAYERYNDIMG